MSEGGVLTWTDFGARQPSFIVSFMPASCPPSSSYTGEKNEQKLWIHHSVILQLFHPLSRFYPGDGSPISFSDDNHNLFVERENQ